jgi:methyl-accepting chemotaxis protein
LPAIWWATVWKQTLTISQSLAANICARYRTRTGILSSILPSTVADQALLLAALGVAALAFVGDWYRRLAVQNRRLSTALDNMSQRLLMFDAQGRIVLQNTRCIDMYKVSPKIVRPGCTLHELIQHRKETGLFVGDVKTFCQKVIDGRQRSKHASLCASQRRTHRARQERAAAGRRLGLHP